MLKPLSSRRPREAARRIAPLASLPVFLTLAERRALVVGGSAAAAWKAELLAAAGAKVRVVACEFSEEMTALLERAEVKVQGRQRTWWESDLEDAALAIADLEGEEAARFAAAARREGVSCNVIDKPAYCDFQFGAIVNRSPVVIGISTGGAAPVLGQAIRRRIETLLPSGLAAWAAAARDFRVTLARLLPSAERRRTFWRGFAELAFTEARGDLTQELRNLAAAGQPVSGDLPGVTLVGAGPGDAGLLTLNALRALQSADVILFDDLVSQEELDLARREARRLLVGKRGGRESCRQEDINAMMVKLARQGKRVVRLKAGDPMIFGRAGEEIAELEAAGIPVQVIPGITATLGAAARLGVSLTHRDTAQSLQLVTAHSRKGGLPEDVDWARLADPRSTIMLYMGARTAAEAAGRLLAEGLDGATPAVIMTAVSRPEERIETLSLSGLAERQAIDHSQPVLIGIGAVFGKLRVSAAAFPAMAAAEAATPAASPAALSSR